MRTAHYKVCHQVDIFLKWTNHQQEDLFVKSSRNIKFIVLN